MASTAPSGAAGGAPTNGSKEAKEPAITKEALAKITGRHEPVTDIRQKYPALGNVNVLGTVVFFVVVGGGILFARHRANRSLAQANNFSVVNMNSKDPLNPSRPFVMPSKLPYSIDKLLLTLNMANKANALPTSKELRMAYQRFTLRNSSTHLVSAQDTLGKLNSALVANTGSQFHDTTVLYKRALADIEKLERLADGKE
jgi:hypothetical protein